MPRKKHCCECGGRPVRRYKDPWGDWRKELDLRETAPGSGRYICSRCAAMVIARTAGLAFGKL